MMTEVSLDNKRLAIEPGEMWPETCIYKCHRLGYYYIAGHYKSYRMATGRLAMRCNCGHEPAVWVGEDTVENRQKFGIGPDGTSIKVTQVGSAGIATDLGNLLFRVKNNKRCTLWEVNFVESVRRQAFYNVKPSEKQVAVLMKLFKTVGIEVPRWVEG
jgi:hypothetical protein